MDIYDPIVRFFPATYDIVDEDVLFYHECFKVGPDSSDTNPNWWYYVICDGHNGIEAANFVRDNFETYLKKRLPRILPHAFDSPEGLEFAKNIEHAMMLVFDELDSTFRELKLLSGTTLTVALIVKSLVTICNVGDTHAFIQSGGKSYPMTACHRIEENKKERERIEKSGVFVAGLRFDGGSPNSQDDTYGPARAWPAGITLSRTIGDIDAPKEIRCRPFIKQVVLLDGGARIVMASDGLWDVLGSKRVLSMAKKLDWDKLADKFIYMLASGGQASDDATVAIIDIMPRHLKHLQLPNHPTVVSKLRCFGMAQKSLYLEVVLEVDTLEIEDVTVESLLDFRRKQSQAIMNDSVREITTESVSTEDDEDSSSSTTTTPSSLDMPKSRKKKLKNVYNVAEQRGRQESTAGEGVSGTQSSS